MPGCNLPGQLLAPMRSSAGWGSCPFSHPGFLGGTQRWTGLWGTLARRWVNCLLIREIPFTLAIRLWDTYLAEGARMRDFLTYVLAAFLLTWSPQLRGMDFQVRVRT